MHIGMPKSEWSRILKWTNYGKEDSDSTQRREYVKRLDQRSREMTRDWPNSLENVNRRNEEIRQARNLAAEQANSKFYKKYVKRQKAEQERLMHSARDVIFKNKDAPKFLLSAVIETAVQKERAEQLKFKKKLDDEARAKKRQVEDEIIQRAGGWHEMVKEQKEYRFKINKEHQKELIGQIEEIHKKKRNEYETELSQQKFDNIMARKEMDIIKEFEDKLKEDEKARIRRDMAQARDEAEAMRKEREARDRLGDQLQEVFNKSRCRIDARRKQTENDMKEEKIRIVQRLSNRLAESTAGAEAREMEICNKAIEEKYALDDAKVEAKRRKMEAFRQELLDIRKQFLIDEEQRLQDLNTMKKWEMINRYKNNELFEDYKEHERLARLRNINLYKQEILKQKKEQDDREEREKAETRYFYGELALKKLRDADNKLLTHAQALLEECRRLGRPDYPLKKAIHKYCSMYRLHPAPPLPAALQRHFPTYQPQDLTKPDPDYVEPPPPPPKEDQDGFAPIKPAGPPPAEKGTLHAKTSEPKIDPNDYRRQGKADGLQQKPETTDKTIHPPRTILPPITPKCCKC